MSNVLFFMTDQQHADCLSYMGHPMVKTPNLDRLAAKACVFRRMYTCSAYCSPSRTSFYTGMYPRSHGHLCNAGDLRQKVPNLAGELKRHGYTTIQCGKNHLPDAIACDFDRLYTMAAYHQDLADAGLEEQPESVRTDPALNKKQFKSYQTPLPEAWTSEAWTSQRAVDFLESPEAARNPWLLWCSFERPHAPHSPPATFDEMYNPDDVTIDWDAYTKFEHSRIGNRPMIEDFWNIGACRGDLRQFQKAVCRYFALISLIDQEVGRVLETLEQRGLAEDTSVVFTSDHGDWAGHYGALGKNLPGYDHLLRIPFIYYDPQRSGDDGRSVEGMYQSIDLMPTLLSRLGFEVPPTVQGTSLLPALDGYPGSTRDYIFAETSTVKTIRSKNWKLNFYVRHPERGQLFRMGPEPDELTNLWDESSLQTVKTELLQQLAAWMASCEQPGSMCTLSEEYIDTRWYQWLSLQPQQCAVRNSETLPNVVQHADSA